MRFWLGAFGILAFLLLFGCAGGPSNVAAKQAGGGIDVSWSPAGGAVGYAVYRSTDAASEGIRLNPKPIVGETEYVDTSVINGMTYYYTVKAIDASGKETAGGRASATAKITPPQNLAITINGGANYTTEKTLTLSLSAAGAAECRFSNDGSTWSDWEAYSTMKAWTVSGGDGPKDVFYQCRDEIGNMAQPVSAAVYLNTQPPRILLSSPAQNGEYAGGFRLVFTVTDSADPWARTATCSGTVDSNPIAIGAVTLGNETGMDIYAAPGTHVLGLECADGNLKTSQSVTFTVVDKPDVSLVLADGSGYTASGTVSARITSKLARDCRLSNDGTAWGSWFPYVTSNQWMLTPGDGTKHVYAQCRSGSGTMSDIVSDTIILDTTPPPYISISINNGAHWTNSRDVTLGLYAYAAAQCRYSNDGYTWSSWEPYSTWKPWTLTQDQGSKTVYYSCKKRNGDDVGSTSAGIIFSPVPPNPPSDMTISINGGDEYTTSTRVTLRLREYGASACRLRQDSYDWTDWEDYEGDVSFTLRGGDGQKTVYYQCMNDYGTKTIHGSIYLVTSPPSRITDLRASAGYSSIYLSWSRPDGAISSYSIYRSATSLGMFTLLATTSSVSYVDRNAMPGETYAYTVKARDTAGQQSPDSNVATATISGDSATAGLG
ncbi:MAG: hypothetical protein PHV13_05660 [Candidatus ainarchaeum sp.]|nr:hypothetical protein [Candidatus ainarchaeum sp.]